MSVSGFFRQHPHLRRSRLYEAILIIAAVLVLLFLASRALGQPPGRVTTPPAQPFRPGLASTGRLDFTIAGVRTIKYDRGRRSVTATVRGREVTLEADKHPGALIVFIRGAGGEVTGDNWHRPSGHVLLWQTLVPKARPLGDQKATLQLELPVVDSSPRFTILVLSAADIDAARSVGLALQGR